MKVGSFVESVGCTIFVLMLIHAIATKGAKAGIRVRHGEVSVSDSQREPVLGMEDLLARNPLETFFVSS